MPNDVLMFAYAGLSIAMGNASPRSSGPPAVSQPPIRTRASPTRWSGSFFHEMTASLAGDYDKGDDMAAQVTTAADVLVIFGITGDLAKKMTFRALYHLERRRMLQGPVIGVARDEWSAAGLRDHARRAVEDTVEMIDEQVFQRFAERLAMVSGDFGDPKTYDRVARAIEGRRSPVFYMEIPPSLFGRVVEAWPAPA